MVITERDFRMGMNLMIVIKEGCFSHRMGRNKDSGEGNSTGEVCVEMGGGVCDHESTMSNVLEGRKVIRASRKSPDICHCGAQQKERLFCLSEQHAWHHAMQLVWGQLRSPAGLLLPGGWLPVEFP